MKGLQTKALMINSPPFLFVGMTKILFSQEGQKDNPFKIVVIVKLVSLLDKLKQLRKATMVLHCKNVQFTINTVIAYMLDLDNSFYEVYVLEDR